MRYGGEGKIETGKLKGLRFVIPSEVLVEQGDLNGTPKFHLACLIHEEFIPTNGCQKCQKEVEAMQGAQTNQQEVMV